MAHWLTLVIIGAVVYCVTLIPPFPPDWRPAAQGLAGLLIVVGLVILVLSVLGIGLP